jgi:hypothetical protein
VQFVSKCAWHDRVLIEQHENYQKQSFRNRCEIYHANGRLSLTVPVINEHGRKTKIKDCRVDNHRAWQNNHWRSIESSYRSSPFYEFYRDDLQEIFQKRYEFLLDLNHDTLQLALSWLDMDCTCKRTDEYIFSYPHGYNDFRYAIHPKKQFRQVDTTFQDISYTQVFEEKQGFQSNLSILDLLFNEGPNAKNLLKQAYHAPGNGGDE